jgi:hypothetical protein
MHGRPDLKTKVLSQLIITVKIKKHLELLHDGCKTFMNYCGAVHSQIPYQYDRPAQPVAHGQHSSEMTELF